MNILDEKVETSPLVQEMPNVASWDKLSDGQRNIVTMACRFGMSDEEIATACDVQVATVRNHIARAKDRLGISNRSPRFLVTSFFMTGPGSVAA